MIHCRSPAPTFSADSTDSVPVIVGACAGPSRIQNSNDARSGDRIVIADVILLSGTLQP